MSKPVILRPAAQQDIEAATDHYRHEGGAVIGIKWVAAVQTALVHIGSHPGTGSPRYQIELKLDGLRFWRTSTFPYLIFYVEREDHVDVWRVLHEKRDIPAWLR